MKVDTLNLCSKKMFEVYKSIITTSANVGASVYKYLDFPCFLKLNTDLSSDYRICDVYDIFCENSNIGTIYLFKECIFIDFRGNLYLFYYEKYLLPKFLKKYSRYLK